MSPWNPAVWISQNWFYIAAWIGLGVFFYRLYTVVRKFEMYGENITKAKTDLEIIMSNHLPHLQTELEIVNQNIIGLRESVRDGFSGLRDDLRSLMVMSKEK